MNGVSVTFAMFSGLCPTRRTGSLTSLDKLVARLYADHYGQQTSGTGGHLMEPSRPEALDLLQLDIDTRLAEIWFEIWARRDWASDEIGPLLRLAYGCGYADALIEPKRGQLCLDHGLNVPSRRRTA